MSIADTIKSLVGAGSGDVDVKEYRCEECDHTFDSAKPPDRAQCIECLSNDVVVLEAGA